MYCCNIGDKYWFAIQYRLRHMNLLPLLIQKFSQFSPTALIGAVHIVYYIFGITYTPKCNSHQITVTH